MTHRVLQIIDAVEAVALTAPLLETRVDRTSLYPRGESEVPALGIRLANWRPTSEDTHKFLAETFVNLGIYAAGASNVDKTLLDVDAELHGLLMADETLGLPFVVQARRIDFPTDANAEGDVPTGSAIAQYAWQFWYPRPSVE